MALGLVAALPVAGGERNMRRSAEELVNVFLAPGNAQWLVGPIARLATAEEVEAYLAITDDEAAERFIDEFWASQEPFAGTSELSARQHFEHLAEEADRLYSETAFSGRHTDRGTIFVLYGPPDEVDFKPARSGRRGRYRSPPMSSRYGLVERWRYHKGKVGLDGQSPKREYRFVRQDGLTRFAD